MTRPNAWPHYFPSRRQKARPETWGNPALANLHWLISTTAIRQTSLNLSAPWHTPMKEIIKGAIVIHPAFRSEVTFVTDKKGRVLIVSFKFH
jgi:2-hydroxy-3-keto-5-methylthiopentenyl-1-phosphate phosphatase